MKEENARQIWDKYIGEAFHENRGGLTTIRKIIKGRVILKYMRSALQIRETKQHQKRYFNIDTERFN